MKTNKTLIQELIQQYTASVTGEEPIGISTQYISDRLNIQRTNISSILNQLVREGHIEKCQGRPVLYRSIHSDTYVSKEQSCFNQLLGHDGALKSPIQLAKAAILYPGKSLHALITGASGTGKSFFSKLMHQFAIDNVIIKSNAPYVKINCAHYKEDSKLLEEMLLFYGEKSLLQKAEGGVLYIDNADLLPQEIRAELFKIIETHLVDVRNDLQKINIIFVCSLSPSATDLIYAAFKKVFYVDIHLPSLENRPLNERLSLVQSFLSQEAHISKRSISITSEILICLLLYHCEKNIKQLLKDIQLGCANAYVREFTNTTKELQILMSDFPHQVRTGFLSFKKNKVALQNLLNQPQTFVFSESSDFKVSNTLKVSSGNPTSKKNLYDFIDSKVKELQDRGIDQNDINLILSIDIENEFKAYSKKLSEQIVNIEHLTEIVSKEIQNLVEVFLSEATKQFKKVYPISIFYALCLHISATLKQPNRTQRLSNEQILNAIQENSELYGFSLQFITKIESHFNQKLPIDEVVFITLFLSKSNANGENAQQPALLLAMHGESTANSMAAVVNSMSGYQTHAFDLPMDKSPLDAYEELKTKILSIHQGKGVLVMYDMGSFKTIFEMIQNETGIKIAMIEMPIPLIALECTRKVTLGLSLDEIQRDIYDSFKVSFDSQNFIDSNKEQSVILTLCMTGEGTAVQIKKHIEANTAILPQTIIPLAYSDTDELIAKVEQIKESSNILCAIGAFDPQLIGIRYLDIQAIFQCPVQMLESLLINNEQPSASNDDYNLIFDHLATELVAFDVSAFKAIIPILLEGFSNCSDYQLTKQQALPLMIHIACYIEHYKSGKLTKRNTQIQHILKNNPELSDTVKVTLKLVENAFSIAFDDNEIANIVSIILNL